MRDMSGLVRTATSQHGLLTTSQLRELGCDASMQKRLVRAGALLTLRRGVVALPAAEATWEQALSAALLASGPGSFASHRSALRCTGFGAVSTASS